MALALAAGALGLGACSSEVMSADPQVIAQTDAAFQELTAGDEKALLARLPPEVGQNPGQVRMLGLMRQLLPAGKPGRYDLIGWRVFAGTNGRRHNVVLRYAYPNGEHVTATGLFGKSEKADPWKMTGFNINPSTPDEVAMPPVAAAIGSAAKAPAEAR